MKLFLIFLFPILMSSCAAKKTKFIKEKVCSERSLKYLRNPRNKEKRVLHNPKLIQDMARTTQKMQLCYEDFKRRSRVEEFNTCLVVGVDQNGSLDFYNFSSQEIELDSKFKNCARSVTGTVPYPKYGSNYILIQAYEFYLGGI